MAEKKADARSAPRKGRKRKAANASSRRLDAFAIFEPLADPIAATDLSGTVCFANRSLAEMMGCRRREMVGKPFTDWLDEPDGLKFREFLSDAASGEAGPKMDEFGLTGRNGNRVPVYMSLSPVDNVRGNPGHVVCIAREIGRYRTTIDVLRHHEETFRSLFEQVNDAIIIHDLNGRIHNFNQRTVELFGFDRPTLLSMNTADLHPGSEAKNSRRAFEETVGKGSAVFESKIKRADGKLIDVEISSRVFDKSKGIVQGVIRDVTKRKQAEALLNKSQAQLIQTQKMEALGTLVAGVAHEINNPINSLLFNVPLIQGIWQDLMPVMEKAAQTHPGQRFGGLTFNVLRENLTQVLSDMDMAAKRVAKIVTGLKDFSRKSSVTEKAEIDINAALDNAVRLAQTTMRKSGIVLESDICENLPGFRGDIHSIEQVFLNLIINAVQSIDHDHGKVWLKTGFRESDETVFLTVSDNGCGVPPGIAERIFDPFVTDKHSNGGSGLGLSVSYSLVQAHNGEITFESRPGGGTTFTVFFPTRESEKTARILIVEDERSVRKMLVRVLSKKKIYQIETAENGSEALIKLGTYAPDLLILDVFMPEINGLEVCRVIRQEKALSDMKVLIITGHPEAPVLKEIAALGFAHVEPKPLDTHAFSDKVDRMLAEGE